MNKRNYLATIVYNARGADGSSDEMIPKLSEIIRQSEGEVKKVENQGNHDFIYPQSKEVTSGTYLQFEICLLYTSPSPRDLSTSRMPSSA